MSKYSDISTEELRKRWETQRTKVVNHTHSQADLDELLAMRKELDKRNGEKNPSIDYNFVQNNTTD